MDQYERLKAEIGDIAKAVNDFKSEAVQQQAFRALVRALGVPTAPAAEDDDDEDSVEAEARNPTGARRARSRKRKATPEDSATNAPRAAKRRVTGLSIDGKLNLRLAGKQTFQAYAEEKKPQNFEERNVVSVHYLKSVLGIDKVTVDQVYTCYMDRKWRVPTNLRNSLSKTTYKGWLDSSSMDDIKVTMPGQNYVVHDLPAKTSK